MGFNQVHNGNFLYGRELGETITSLYLHKHQPEMCFSFYRPVVENSILYNLQFENLMFDLIKTKPDLINLHLLKQMCLIESPYQVYDFLMENKSDIALQCKFKLNNSQLQGINK